MTIFDPLLKKITTASIRPQVKWAVNLVIIDGHYNLPRVLWGYDKAFIAKHVTPCFVLFFVCFCLFVFLLCVFWFQLLEVSRDHML